MCRPLHRYEFVLGKYLGLSFLLALVTGVMTGVACVYVIVLGGTLDGTFFEAILLIYVELLLITAFAVLLSAVTSPILGALIVFSLFVLCNATNILIDLPQQVKGTGFKQVLETIYYLVPNLSNFDIRAEAANGRAVPAAYILWTILYGAGYTVMLLVLASLAFQDKDV